MIAVQLLGTLAVESQTRVLDYDAVCMLGDHDHRTMEMNLLPSHIIGLVLKSNTVWKDRLQAMTKVGKIDTLKQYMPALHRMLTWASTQGPRTIDLDTIERFQEAAKETPQYHARCFDGAPDNLERMVIRGVTAFAKELLESEVVSKAKASDEVALLPFLFPRLIVATIGE